MTRSLIIEADGGSRGNPGPSGSGAVVIDANTGEILREIALFVGVGTNNRAEYLALEAGLRAVNEIDPTAELLVLMDSKLVIEQSAGRWKIKHPDMRELAMRVQSLVGDRRITWQWIPREQNSRADALANRAMDAGEEALVAQEIDQPGNDLNAATPAIASAVEFNKSAPSSVRAPGKVTEPLTTLILVRHGRTALTESNKLSGSGGEDPSLSEAGFADAAAVAEAIASFGVGGAFAHLPAPTAVLASPILRTKQTALTIAERIGRRVELLPEIAEISFGDWDGYTVPEVRERWGESFELWRGSWETSPPNGESLEAFDRRIQRGINDILANHGGETVVAVSHVMPIRGFVRFAMDAGVAAYWRPQIAPCSITVLRLWGRQAAEVVTVNSTAHLA